MTSVSRRRRAAPDIRLALDLGCFVSGAARRRRDSSPGASATGRRDIAPTAVGYRSATARCPSPWAGLQAAGRGASRPLPPPEPELILRHTSPRFHQQLVQVVLHMQEASVKLV